MSEQETAQEIPLFISSSTTTTESNKTGTWRFVRPAYDEKTAPCSGACPVGEDIARIEMLAAQGNFKEAWKTILMENPFPAVCGRVCFHPCETYCNRKEFDQPIAIHHLERFLGDMAIRSQACKVSLQESEIRSQQSGVSSQQRIAIIGAGPAGLSAAYFLSRLGHECDVFEAKSEPGGVLRWGIPRYRLPEDVLKDEMDRILCKGVKLYCDHPVTEDFFEQAKDKYDAVFMGCGHGKSLKMNIPGEGLTHDGLEFLYHLRKEKDLESLKGKDLEGFRNLQGLTIAVIGGGNTAIDVVRSLVRLGAKPILVYRRRKQDMPAFAHEVEMAIKEGVEIRELLSPVSIEAKNENYLLTLQQMKPADKSEDGRTCVIPDSGKREFLEVRKIFTAIGAEPEKMCKETLHSSSSEKMCKETLHSSESTSRTLLLSHCRLWLQGDKTCPMVFGGDLTNPIKSVTDAIASGKQVAMALDTFFQTGWDMIETRLAACRVGNGNAVSMEIYTNGERKKRNPHTVSFNEINTDYFQSSPRINPLLVQVSDLNQQLPDKIHSFSEIEKTFSTNLAMDESKRCFNCGICNDCDNCRLFCPDVSVEVSNNRADGSSLRLEPTRADGSSLRLEPTPYPLTPHPLNYRHINLDYCKGCGICVVECPRNAISLEEERI